MKIVLRVPHYSDVVFNSYEDLNFIWKVIENYNDCQLIVVDNEDEEEFDKQQEVQENIETVDEITNTVTLTYLVPKSVTFTQRFQERIVKEVFEVLNTVYPEQFEITSVKYQDIEENPDEMKMVIEIKAANDKGLESLKYLDNNVEYIIKDLVEYYL